MNAWTRDLERALRRLDENQGRTARRNARHAVFAALKKVRRMVDEAYPPIEKAAKAPRVSMTTEAIAARFHKKMRRRDYVAVNSGLEVSLMKAGVKLVRQPRRARAMDGAAYAPAWAVVASRMESAWARIEELKKDPKAQKALLAAHRLGGV